MSDLAWLRAPSPARKQEAMMRETREEVDAKIAAPEARTDTKLTRLEGKLDLVLARFESVHSDAVQNRNATWTVGALIIGTMVALAALVAAVAPAAYSGGAA